MSPNFFPFQVDSIPELLYYKRNVALQVGLIDADIFAWGGEDGSLQDKIIMDGYKIYIVPSAKTWHDYRNDRNEFSERLTPEKLYYSMRSKSAHIRLYEKSRMRKFVLISALPIFILYYEQLVVKCVPGSRNRFYRTLHDTQRYGSRPLLETRATLVVKLGSVLRFTARVFVKMQQKSDSEKLNKQQKT